MHCSYQHWHLVKILDKRRDEGRGTICSIWQYILAHLCLWGEGKARVGFTDEVGPKLGHKGLMRTVFPSLQEIIVGNRLIEDVRCITPSLTHIQVPFCEDSGLSGLSYLYLEKGLVQSLPVEACYTTYCYGFLNCEGK